MNDLGFYMATSSPCIGVQIPIATASSDGDNVEFQEAVALPGHQGQLKALLSKYWQLHLAS